MSERDDKWGSETSTDIGVDVTQSIEQLSPLSTLYRELANSRKCNGTHEAPRSDLGFSLTARPRGVHFIAPLADGDNSLQTIVLTPKTSGVGPLMSPSVRTSTAKHVSVSSGNGAFLVRRNSCESATSQVARKEKGFNIFGMRISRPAS